MSERKGAYFVSDVHLGLDVKDPQGRERRFIEFVRSIPTDTTAALYLLGDIWDFWYEYRDVVPKRGIRVVAALQDLMDAGVEVYFFPGNHDIWCYHYFEELGIKVVRNQPLTVTLGSTVFCLAHGDTVGNVTKGYRFMNRVFKCRPLQKLFSTLHPRLAFGLGLMWSRHSRLSRGEEYSFKGLEEPLCQWAQTHSEGVDCFIFGHLHVPVDLQLPSGARLIVMDDWMDSSPYWYFDGISVLGGCSMKMEK